MKKFFAPLCAAITLGLSGTSSAVVIFFVDDIEIPGFPNSDGVYVDFETGAFGPASFATADAHFVFGGFSISNIAATPLPSDPSLQFVQVASNNTTVDNMAVGEMVGPGGPFSNVFGDSSGHVIGPNATFTADSTGYLGFTLEHSSLGTIYGWAEVTFLEADGSGTIHKFVWQNNGDAIPVGVPEPTTPLLAFLGVGLLAFRRRR